MTFFALLAAIAALFAAGMFALWRRTRRPAVLVAALCWGAYAGWEAWVQWRTPEADIRVDLLLFIPLLGFASLAALLAAWRARRRGMG
jgi:hypothetical protein